MHMPDHRMGSPRNGVRYCLARGCDHRELVHVLPPRKTPEQLAAESYTPRRLRDLTDADLHWSIDHWKKKITESDDPLYIRRYRDIKQRYVDELERRQKQADDLDRLAALIEHDFKSLVGFEIGTGKPLYHDFKNQRYRPSFYQIDYDFTDFDYTPGEEMTKPHPIIRQVLANRYALRVLVEKLEYSWSIDDEILALSNELITLGVGHTISVQGGRRTLKFTLSSQQLANLLQKLL